MGSQKKLETKNSGLITEGDQSGERGVYKGNWKANKMEGFGIFKWASGRIYVGDWKADMKDGLGILSFKGGNEYMG